MMLQLLWLLDKTDGSSNTVATLQKVEGLLNMLNKFRINPLADYVFGMMDSTFTSVLALDAVETDEALARKLLDLIFKHRKLQPGHKCERKPCQQCYALHLEKLHYFIQKQAPIQLVLPAFPAKSPSPDKVLGPLPDLGEELALQNLQQLCNQIQDLYAPGAEMAICADGRVFSDLVLVSDADVSAYTKALNGLIQQHDLHSLRVINLENLLPGQSFEAARELLVEQYARPLPELREEVKTVEHRQRLFNGLHRFITEDQRSFYPQLSNTQYKKHTSEVALQVMQRSDAWGAMLNRFFPQALRLSIHPQHPHSPKIGIHLTKASSNWITPWHGVVVLHPENGYVLQKKQDAVRSGATLMYNNEQPYYYTLEDNA